MFGLDEWIAHLSDNPLVFVVVVSVFLGFRHATDPDHLSAMLTLRLRQSQRSPGRLGAAWGVGHAFTMLLVGTPLILFVAELPKSIQQSLEFAVGVMIIGLAIRAIWSASQLTFHTHEHIHHDSAPHTHLHAHGNGEHVHKTPTGAAMMGLLHGAGGSAGVVALVLGRVADPLAAIAALLVISVFSGVSMAACSWFMCRSLDGPARLFGQRRVAVAGGFLTALFGAWYCAAALEAVPYPF